MQPSLHRWGFRACTLALLIALPSGCDNNSSTEGEDGNRSGFRISPSAVTFEFGDSSAAFSAVGGSEPFTWSVTDPGLGSIPATTARTANYTRTPGRQGINTIQVVDASGNRASAMAVQQSLGIVPSTATIPAGTDSLAFTASGGNEPFTWNVTDGSLGGLSATRGRNVVYLRASANAGRQTIRVRDASGAQTEAVLNQQ